MPSVTKVKVVPPSFSRGSRSWWVRTTTGVRKGGSSPHQPSHGSSPQGPGPPPNIPRPMIPAPTFSDIPSITGVLSLTSPPSSPCASRKAASGNAHACSAMPPTPSGFSTLWFGPATKPSSDIVMLNLSLLIVPPRVVVVSFLGTGGAAGRHRRVEAPLHWVAILRGGRRPANRYGLRGPRHRRPQ